MAQSNLTGLSGIGTATARILEHHGFHSISDVAAATTEALCTVPGFGKIRSSAIIGEAKQKVLLGDPAIKSNDSDSSTRIKGKKNRDKKKRKKRRKKNKDGKKKP